MSLRHRKKNSGKPFGVRDYAFLVKNIEKEYTKYGDMHLASIKPCRINYIRFPALVSESLHIWGCSAITDAERSAYYADDVSEFYRLNKHGDHRTFIFELFIYKLLKFDMNTKQINIISMFNNMDRDDYRKSGTNFVEENNEKALWQKATINIKPDIQIKINYLLLEIEDNNYLPASILYPLYMKLSFRPHKQTIVHCCCGLGRTSWVIISLELLRNIKYKKVILSILVSSVTHRSKKVLKERGLAFYELVKSLIYEYSRELLHVNSVFYKRMNILIYMLARKHNIQTVHVYDTSHEHHLEFISIPYAKICTYVNDVFIPFDNS